MALSVHGVVAEEPAGVHILRGVIKIPRWAARPIGAAEEEG